MSKYSGANTVIEFDNAGGSLVDMSQYILEMNGIDVEALFEDSHTFGDSWRERLPAGFRQVDDIELSGFYDDTATTGPDVIFNAPAATVSTASRTLKVTFGGTKTASVECFIKKYSRKPVRATITRFSVTLTTTGAVTET